MNIWITSSHYAPLIANGSIDCRKARKSNSSAVYCNIVKRYAGKLDPATDILGFRVHSLLTTAANALQRTAVWQPASCMPCLLSLQITVRLLCFVMADRQTKLAPVVYLAAK